MKRLTCLQQLCPDLVIRFKWSITYHEANRDPLVHLLRCLISPTILVGGSVKALHPGIYLKTQSLEYLLRISNHMTLSSAKYMLASFAVCFSDSSPLKNDLSGSPSMASHLNVLKAPGSTDTKPNKVSKAFSM